MRPRRKRKHTNYGEGHLHWIEESQLQKALIKSLREKSSKHRRPTESESDNDAPSTSQTSKVSSLSTSASPSTSGGIQTRTRSSREPQSARNKKSREHQSTDSNSSSASDQAPHVIMMKSKSKNASKDEMSNLSSKIHDKETDTSDDIASSSVQNPKTRAQRKFASGSSQSSRSGSRTDKKLRKSNRSNLDHKVEPISDGPLPDTKDFINYLCFRNTPLKIELDDGS